MNKKLEVIIVPELEEYPDPFDEVFGG